MRVGGRAYRSIWLDDATGLPNVIDQTMLPHRFEIRSLATLEDAAEAIRTMRVRGAPLIGATAAHGLALALREDASDEGLRRAAERLRATRPTAVNLGWALERMVARVRGLPTGERAERARSEAVAICDEDVAACERIGRHGVGLLETLAARGRDGRPLRILTHCNAGWLATVDWGTALAPIYRAHDTGLPVHVWVDETRPRNQGASLTAFELGEHGVPHTVIVDNAGGHLMQRGEVDVVMVGSDRTTATGDVCNKIGTYLKALAAHANGIPFYVALPCSTIDWKIRDGLAEVPIEERSPDEVRRVSGFTRDGCLETIELLPSASPAANPAFDITPAALVSALVTEHGVYPATSDGLASLKEAQRLADVEAMGRPERG